MRQPVLCDSLMPNDVIYALVDPHDPERVRYVGRTCDPVGRYRAHSVEGSNGVAKWMAQVTAAGRTPVMLLLERCACAEAEARELHWIRYYRQRDQADLNRRVANARKPRPARSRAGQINLRLGDDGRRELRAVADRHGLMLSATIKMLIHEAYRRA
jgi:hypothetical protein